MNQNDSNSFPLSLQPTYPRPFRDQSEETVAPPSSEKTPIFKGFSDSAEEVEIFRKRVVRSIRNLKFNSFQ